MISIFVSNCLGRIEQNRFETYLQILNPEEQRKIKKYKKWDDAQLTLLGRLLLMRGLSSFGYKHTEFQLEFTASNKPFIQNGPHFNISHSGQFVVCAISEHHDVGIDIERIAPINIQELKDQWSNVEWQTLSASKDPIRLFYNYWTKKESVVKADGRGLGIPLREVDVTSNITALHNRQWFLTEVLINPDYVCHVASQIKDSVQVIPVSF